MARQICTMALAVPPLSLTPQALGPSLHLCLCLFHPAVSFWKEKDQGKTDLKPNKTTKSGVFCFFTLLNQQGQQQVGTPARAGWTFPEQAEPGQLRLSLSSCQILLQGNSSSLLLLHCHFEILTTPRIRAERIRHINKRPCPAWMGRWVISPRSLSLLRYSTCTALLWAEPHCSCWLAPEQHWASRTCFCGLKKGWRLQANKSILVRSQIQSCPVRKKQWYAQCKSHQVLKTSLPGSQQRTAPRQQCYSHSHMPA